MKKYLCLLLLLCLPAIAQNATPITAKTLTMPLLNAPEAPTSGSATVLGNPGNATYYFWVVASTIAGNASPAGPYTAVRAPNQISASDQIFVAWNNTGALSYDLLMTSAPAQPSGACGCAIATGIAAAYYSVSSSTTSAYTVNTLNPAMLSLTLQNEATSAGIASLAAYWNGAREWTVDSTGAATYNAIKGKNINGVLGAAQYSSLSAACTALGGVNGTVQITGTEAVTANTTIPTNCGLWFPVGSAGQISISSGVTLTVLGPVEAGPVQIFSGAGTISFSGNYMQDRAYIEWWGAVCNDSTDDTNAVQKAFNQVGIVPLYIPNGAGCLIKSPLTFNDQLHLRGSSIVTSKSLLDFSLTVPASTQDVLLQPASGQTGAYFSIHGVTLEASNVDATDGTSTLIGLLLPQAEQATVERNNFIPPSGWIGGTTIGLEITNINSGQSFYGIAQSNSFGPWSSDITLSGVPGGLVNAWTFINNLFQGTGTSSVGTVDITGADSDTWISNDFSTGTYGIVLHGPNITAQSVYGGYVDGTHTVPFAYATGFTSPTSGILSVRDVPGMSTAASEFSGFPSGGFVFSPAGGDVAQLKNATQFQPGANNGGPTCAETPNWGSLDCIATNTPITAANLEVGLASQDGAGVAPDVMANQNGNNTVAGIGACQEWDLDTNYLNQAWLCVAKETLSSFTPTFKFYGRTGSSTVGDFATLSSNGWDFLTGATLPAGQTFTNNGTISGGTVNATTCEQGGVACTLTIASGTATMGTAAISAGTCATAVTVAATNVTTTDSINWSFNAAPGTGWPSLTVQTYPTAGDVSFLVCNPTAGSVTPAAATLNWRVVR